MPRIPQPKNVVYGLYAKNDPSQVVVYVGLTTRGAVARLGDHRARATAGNRRPLYRWMREVGVHNVGAEVLEALESRDGLGEAEARWIETLGTHQLRNGFNLSTGGEEGARGASWSKESRERASISQKARGPLTPEQRERWLQVNPKGEMHGMAKLTTAQVRSIKPRLWD